MRLRWADPADLLAIAHLHTTSWETHYTGLMPAAFLKHGLRDEMARRWAVMPPAHDILIVADAGDGITGFSYVKTREAAGPLLESLHVRTAVQGQGTGTRLMAATAHAVAAVGHDGLWLEVLNGNHAARAAYARWGGKESDVFEDVVAGQTVQAHKVIWDNLAVLRALGPAVATENASGVKNSQDQRQNRA